jgi:hypothetical protein
VVGVSLRRQRAIPQSGLDRLPIDLLLTILGSRQPVATQGNGFRVCEPSSRLSYLRPVATVCDRSAP